MRDPARPRVKDVVRVTGWVLVLGAGVLGFFPAVGGGSGAAREPGSATLRWLTLNGVFPVWAVVALAAGLVLVAIAWVLPGDPD